MAETNENNNNKKHNGYGWAATGSLIGGSLPLITRTFQKRLEQDGKGRKKDKKKKSKKLSARFKKKSLPKQLLRKKKRLKRKPKGKLLKNGRINK